jgi:hypothetical protein
VQQCGDNVNLAAVSSKISFPVTREIFLISAGPEYIMGVSAVAFLCPTTLVKGVTEQQGASMGLIPQWQCLKSVARTVASVPKVTSTLSPILRLLYKHSKPRTGISYTILSVSLAATNLMVHSKKVDCIISSR